MEETIKNLDCSTTVIRRPDGSVRVVVHSAGGACAVLEARVEDVGYLIGELVAALLKKVD